MPIAVNGTLNVDMSVEGGGVNGDPFVSLGWCNAGYQEACVEIGTDSTLVVRLIAEWMRRRRAWSRDFPTESQLMEELGKLTEHALATDGWKRVWSRVGEYKGFETPEWSTLSHLVYTDIGRAVVQSLLSEGALIARCYTNRQTKVRKPHFVVVMRELDVWEAARLIALGDDV